MANVLGAIVWDGYSLKSFTISELSYRGSHVRDRLKEHLEQADRLSREPTVLGRSGRDAFHGRGGRGAFHRKPPSARLLRVSAQGATGPATSRGAEEGRLAGI
jgi:hypothetical protein